MKIIKPSVEILDPIDGDKVLEKLERIGRVCYKSEDRIKEGSAAKFIAGIIRSGHESVVEHVNVTVKFTINRGISHQIVRHRSAAYSMESTRYCSYDKDRFGGEVTVIKPFYLKEGTKPYELWKKAGEDAENAYFDLIAMGIKAEEARDVLPHSLKTELIKTANLRSWRHFLKLRLDKASHPQIREIAFMLLKEFQEKLPVIFSDILYEWDEKFI